MLTKRERHSARVADFTVCAEQDLQSHHDALRGVYVGSIILGTFVGGALAPLYLLTMFTTGTLYGSFSNRVDERMASVTGSEASLDRGLSENERASMAAFDFVERMLPVLMVAL